MESGSRHFLSFVAFALLALEGSGHAQDCGSCPPPVLSSPQSVQYRFDANVPPHVRQAYDNAASAYSNKFGSLMSIEYDSSATFVIRIDPSLPCGLAAGAYHPTSGIRLCSLVASSNNPSVARGSAMHEWGHRAGYGNRDESSCWGQTVMGPTNWTGQNPTTFTSTDNCAIDRDFLQPAYCQPPPGGCESGGWWDPDFCYCRYSPVIMSLGANSFRLTSVDAGVVFDLDGDGGSELVSWTAADSDDAFLVLDRNANGVVDGGQELFGGATPMSWTAAGPRATDGFEALAWFDLPASGGAPDGWIDGEDQVFGRLRLWRDVNHDGLSQPEELLTLLEAGIQRISLEVFESTRRDQHGNLFRYRVRVQSTNDSGASVYRVAYDVYLGARQ